MKIIKRKIQITVVIGELVTELPLFKVPLFGANIDCDLGSFSVVLLMILFMRLLSLSG